MRTKRQRVEYIIHRREVCGECRGTGLFPHPELGNAPCLSCGSSGYVNNQEYSLRRALEELGITGRLD